MKAYGIPDHVHVPDFDESMVDGRYSMEKDNEVTEKFYADLKAYLVNDCACTGPMTGEIVRWQRGDGYAQYMVGEIPRGETFLVHIPLHDAWSVEDALIRGLRKTDIKQMIAADKRLAALFGRKS